MMILTKHDNYKECSDLHQSAIVFPGPNMFHTVSKLIHLWKVNYFCFLKPLQEILTICFVGMNWLCERWLFSKCSFRLINMVLIALAWQKIDMRFHLDDCLYNLICMLTSKRKDKGKRLQDRWFAMSKDMVLHVLMLVSSLEDKWNYMNE